MPTESLERTLYFDEYNSIILEGECTFGCKLKKDIITPVYGYNITWNEYSFLKVHGDSRQTLWSKNNRGYCNI